MCISRKLVSNNVAQHPFVHWPLKGGTYRLPLRFAGQRRQSQGENNQMTIVLLSKRVLPIDFMPEVLQAPRAKLLVYQQRAVPGPVLLLLEEARYRLAVKPGPGKGTAD